MPVEINPNQRHIETSDQTRKTVTSAEGRAKDDLDQRILDKANKGEYFLAPWEKDPPEKVIRL